MIECSPSSHKGTGCRDRGALTVSQLSMHAARRPHLSRFCHRCHHANIGRRSCICSMVTRRRSRCCCRCHSCSEYESVKTKGEGCMRCVRCSCVNGLHGFTSGDPVRVQSQPVCLAQEASLRQIQSRNHIAVTLGCHSEQAHKSTAAPTTAYDTCRLEPTPASAVAVLRCQP